jgi:phosphoglycolate phosphatase
MKHDAIIFDLDGTLWDTTEHVALAWNDQVPFVQVPVGPFTADHVRSLCGKTLPEIAEILFPNLDRMKSVEAMERLNMREIEFVQMGAAQSPYAGVGQMLQSLLKHEYRLFIVSNCEAEYLTCFLENTGLAEFIEGAECYGHNRLSKAKNIKLITREFDLKNPIYVGDTAGDEAAAIEAGVTFAHSAYGFGKPVEPCVAFQNVQEIEEYFCRTWEEEEPEAKEAPEEEEPLLVAQGE